MSTILKRCTKCKECKPATNDYFSKDKTRKDNLSCHCKECVNAYREQNKVSISKRRKLYSQEYRKKNKVRIDQYNAEYREENREAIRERNRRYRENNIDKIRKKNRIGVREYRLKNRDRVKNYTKKYRERTRGAHSVYEQRRNAKKRELPSGFTPQQWQRCLDYFNGCCAACGESVYGIFCKPHQDHWIPLSDPNCPGTVVDNIVPLCGGVEGCNNSKSKRAPAEWLESKFGKRKAAAILKRINEYFDHVRANPI